MKFLQEDETEYTKVTIGGNEVEFGSLDAGTILDFTDMNEGPEKKLVGLRMLAMSFIERDKDGNPIRLVPTENGKPVESKLNEVVNDLRRKKMATIETLLNTMNSLNGMEDKKTKKDESGASTAASPSDLPRS